MKLNHSNKLNAANDHLQTVRCVSPSLSQGTVVEPREWPHTPCCRTEGGDVSYCGQIAEPPQSHNCFNVQTCPSKPQLLGSKWSPFSPLTSGKASDKILHQDSKSGFTSLKGLLQTLWAIPHPQGATPVRTETKSVTWISLTLCLLTHIMCFRISVADRQEVLVKNIPMSKASILKSLSMPSPMSYKASMTMLCKL